MCIIAQLSDLGPILDYNTVLELVWFTLCSPGCLPMVLVVSRYGPVVHLRQSFSAIWSMCIIAQLSDLDPILDYNTLPSLLKR